MRLFLIFTLLAISVLSAGAASLKLASGGKTNYVVVIDFRPSPIEEFAASELAYYLEKMSGAHFPIQRTAELPPKALIVSTELADRIRLDARSSSFDDQYVISIEGQRVHLSGSWGGRSTHYAVYDFLERLGCVWLAPKFDRYQGAAEFVPHKSELTFELPEPISTTPALPIRKLYVEEGLSHNAQNLAQIVEWMPKARFNTLIIPMDYGGTGRVKWDNWRKALTPELQKRGIIIEVGGHGYQNFLNAEMEGGQLFNQHPEWFGQDENGHRRREKQWVFCTSNPEAVKYLIANFVKYVQDRPEIQIFDFWPPDGAHWCQCQKCLALGSPSNRQALLVAQVKAEVAKVRPGVRPECLAYHTLVMPPETAKLDKDVLLDFCPIGQCFEYQINDQHSEKNAGYVTDLRAWRTAFQGDISIYSYYRKYAWKSLPVIIPHYMQKDLHFYGTIPVQGISSYAEPGDWFTYELNHYVLGRLAWDPSADVDALIRRFCEARYGTTATGAINAFEVMEQVVRRNCSIPNTSLKSVAELSEAQSELKRVSSELKAAQASVSDEATKRNLGRLLLTLEYAQRDIEIQKSRAVKDPLEQIRKLVRELASFLAQHSDAGVFVVHKRL